jgi:hypothetical protein
LRLRCSFSLEGTDGRNSQKRDHDQCKDSSHSYRSGMLVKRQRGETGNAHMLLPGTPHVQGPIE